MTAAAERGGAERGGAEGEWLAHVPVPLFATVMGVGGLGLAWRRAHEALGLPAAVGEGLLLLAGVLWAAVALLYLAKAARHFPAVAAEFAHPVRVCFFPAAAIGPMILSAGLLPYARGAADAVWIAAAVVQTALALVILGRWIRQDVKVEHVSPAWFIPIVACMLAPLAGVGLGHVEASWFLFAVGFLFWVVLFPIVLNRIIFHGMPTGRLVPTLFILLAPPSVAFLGWTVLHGGAVDALGRVLAYSALFLGILLATLAPVFRQAPFAVSWWAYTFPCAALAAAMLRLHQDVGLGGTAVIGVATLAAATLVVAVVSWRTAVELVRGRLFVPE